MREWQTAIRCTKDWAKGDEPDVSGGPSLTGWNGATHRNPELDVPNTRPLGTRSEL